MKDAQRSKVALITGAASGLGLACAQALSGEGYTVVLSDLNEGGLQDAAAKLGTPSLWIQQDVTKNTRWKHAITEIQKTYGRLDVLVNCAGIVGSGDTIEKCSRETWNRLMEINVNGTFLGCRNAIPLMRKTGGSIINMSSIRGRRGAADEIAYCATKGAVRQLTKSVALHCANKKYGIRCNSVHPGAIETSMHHSWLGESESASELEALMTARYPLGRIGVPNDVAAAVKFLASDASKFMTGAELVVDGGYCIA